MYVSTKQEMHAVVGGFVFRLAPGIGNIHTQRAAENSPCIANRKDEEEINVYFCKLPFWVCLYCYKRILVHMIWKR